MSIEQQSHKNKSEGIDISSMLNDVNRVLHSHLTNILTPMIQEKNSIHNILLNMPMVKKLQEEHLKAQQAVFAIQAEAKALKLFYHGEMQAKQDELIKVKNELLAALKKLDEYKNVTLEVKDIPRNETTPSIKKFTNDPSIKNEKILENESSIKIVNLSSLNSFSILSGDEEEEACVDEATNCGG